MGESISMSDGEGEGVRRSITSAAEATLGPAQTVHRADGFSLGWDEFGASKGLGGPGSHR